MKAAQRLPSAKPSRAAVALTLPTLITFFTASEIMVEWCSKLGRREEGCISAMEGGSRVACPSPLPCEVGQANGQGAASGISRPAEPARPSAPSSGTYFRCRSMLAEESSIAVGLAMFLPTAWAKGWRAPCKRSRRIPAGPPARLLAPTAPREGGQGAHPGPASSSPSRTRQSPRCSSLPGPHRPRPPGRLPGCR